MNALRQFIAEHQRLTRRYLLRLSGAGLALAGARSWAGGAERSELLEAAVAKLGAYFTPTKQFRDVSRGKPLPHSLPEDKKREVGLTRETWRLEVVSDPWHPARLGQQLTKANGTALDFTGLLKLGEKHAVRFAKVMTCLNIGCPLGMGIWEGVPLREVFWLTKPRENIRRVFYYGYHNDDPKQMFLSSLPVGRVLEIPYDLPPVILCYRLNGQWLDAERGGPVRVVVPEGYGFKSIKWLTHVVLTNLPHANDTYASGNNDLESPLKSFAATLTAPTTPPAGQPIAVTGYAQVGIAGVSKVQVWLSPANKEWPADDPYFQQAAWRDAEIMPAPSRWTNLPGEKIPAGTLGFDAAGRPLAWPMRLSKVHWAALLPPMAAGEYALCCRTVDKMGIGQPLPRPFQKSGHAMIETVTIKVGA